LELAKCRVLPWIRSSILLCWQRRNSLYIWLYYTSNLLSQFIVSEKGEKELAKESRPGVTKQDSETSPNTWVPTVGWTDDEQKGLQHI